VDTPGIQKGPGALRQYMRDQALGAAGESDVALLLVDVSDPRQRDPDALGQGEARSLLAAAGEAPRVLALNKIDTLRDRSALLPVLEAFTRAVPGTFSDIVPISATHGDNVDALVRTVAARLPLGPPLYPEDMVTDRAERFLAAELIREQLFRQLGQELPYSSAVVVESFRERPGRGDVVVDGVVYVERESQKGMVVGKGGRRIKQVGERARAAIAQLFGCPAHVMLRVKVAERWSHKPGGIRRMGYE
jgi:GTP-binding protein Era